MHSTPQLFVRRLAAALPTTVTIKRALIISSISLGLAILLALAIGAYVVRAHINQLATTAGYSAQELIDLVQSSYATKPITKTSDTVVFLLLGVDTVENRTGTALLTDTIILVSLDLRDATVRTLSLPRDLWSEEYQTKINALYYYSIERDPQEPTAFVTETLSQLTSVPIDYTLVIDLRTLESLIDTLGGVTLDIPEGFTDERFPRSDVDITTETDPSRLYTTVIFEPGPQTLSGQRALVYIRSRMSEDLTQGTDQARAARQQLVIGGLIEQLLSPITLTNPQQLGQLLALYEREFAGALPTGELLSIGFELLKNPTLQEQLRNKQTPAFHSTTLSVFPEDQDGTITHPPTRQYGGQWVYTIIDRDTFQTTSKNALLVQPNQK